MGRNKMPDEHKNNVRKQYDAHYYNTVKKISRQIARITQRLENEYALRKQDELNYRDEYVNFFGHFLFSHFCVLKEDILTSNLNDNINSVNRQIKEINKGLSDDFKLPMQHLKSRSLKSLVRYTEKYFKHLYSQKIIDRAIWTYEEDKKGNWHVHALINLYNIDVFTHRIKEFWLLSDTPYCEPIKTFLGSLIYITKQWNTYSRKQKEIDKLQYSNWIGLFNKFENDNILNINIINMNKNTVNMDKLEAFKIKYNLVVVIDSKFIFNQKRLNDKYLAKAV
ncbi:hypothetical protein KO02_19500 [Sphingobacterium sp. ML3W]|uniref:hypothetical protein n=1 Tax=Sphingobacterium sp. ML3W TaxID=1538644 RepID=UPI0004F80DB2|nr:hypothetical protein [Sphingobacterium sp. ML3W]AIM38637.1 hypothetical protein KO02_19500 [Sphingobacterium sp. ML3W]